MDVSRRRAGVKNSVAAGSVWESRMKLDEVKGGIKVFNGEENSEETGSKKLVKRGPIGTSSVATSGKRKTWKSESFDGPIQIAKGKTESTSIKSCEEQGRELSGSVDGIKKIPNQTRKGRYEGSKELSLSVDGMDRSPIQVQKGRSAGIREPCVSVDGIDKSPIQVKKGRSEANKEVRVSGDGNEKSPTQIRKARSDTKEVVESAVVQLRKSKSDSVEVANQSGEEVAADSGIQGCSIQQEEESMSASDKVLEESARSGDETFSGIEKSPPEIEEAGSEESSKEFGLCQEKVISSSENMEMVESTPKPLMDAADDHDVMGDEDEEFEADEEDEELEEKIEIQVEKKSFDIKEIDIPEEKAKKVETNIPEPKSKKMEISIPEQKPKEIVNEEKKVQQLRNKTVPISSTVNRQPPPVMRRATIYQSFSKPTPPPVASRYKSFPETHSKLQNLVDLVMWRDISRSAFVFGIGTFIIISSSYTKDLNVSFISVISYLGLFYLATIFLHRSLICRGVYHMDDDTGYVLGEEEAFWLVKLLLPYLNEFLLKIRALFSGDPSTTMKMAVLLFVLARCGNSITIWKMAKLGFFGVFTVPKVCSLYSTQLTAYAKFWIRRFRDAWDSCTHKKAVALAIFTLVWNLSSMVARIWAVFMMFVAVRYYQQTVERDGWVVEEEVEENDDEQCNAIGQKQGRGSTVVINSKAKKKY